MAEADVERALLDAAVASMRPYVRRMLRCNVTFGRLESRLRELFVETAEKESSPTGTVPTDSGISIMTGINRKEVRRIRSLDRERAPRTFSRNLVATLVNRWVTGPLTKGRAGKPRVLPYDASRGPSFTRLAREITADLHPRALLDGLIRAGAAELRDGDEVALTRTAYVAPRGRPESLAMLGDDPPELIETMLHNVLAEGDPPRLQQKLAYDNIGADGLDRLREALRREANHFLKRSNAVLVRHDRDRTRRAPGGERTYAGLGVYYFEEAREPKTSRAASVAPRPKRIRRRRQKP
jgi:hypothetical protein